MNIGLLGGAFDPIHRGHIALARAAMEKCKLSRIYFVTANVPPHKQLQPLSPFLHRYAMVALATAPERVFIPSLLEAPEESPGGESGAALSKSKDKARDDKDRTLKPNYTIDTVRRLKRSLRAGDRLFLLIGIDAFADIDQWHQAEDLFRECAFVVASRPGYSLADVAHALPARLPLKPAVTRPFHRQAPTGDLVWPGAAVHLREKLPQPVSATAIRDAAGAGKSL